MVCLCYISSVGISKYLVAQWLPFCPAYGLRFLTKLASNNSGYPYHQRFAWPRRWQVHPVLFWPSSHKVGCCKAAWPGPFPLHLSLHLYLYLYLSLSLSLSLFCLSPLRSLSPACLAVRPSPEWVALFDTVTNSTHVLLRGPGLSVYLSIHRSIYLSRPSKVCPYIYPSTSFDHVLTMAHMSVCLSMQPLVHQFTCLASHLGLYRLIQHFSHSTHLVVFIHGRSVFVGFRTTRVLFGVYMRSPDFCKVPCRSRIS